MVATAPLNLKSVATTAVSYLYGETAGGAIVRLAAEFTPDVSSTTRFGMKDAGGIFIHENYTAQPPAAYTVGMSLRTQSSLSYTGGTAGNVYSNQWNSVTTSAGIVDYIWAGVDIIDNYADEGNNVARYMQGKQRGAGPTWAAVADAKDYTTNPTRVCRAIEADIFANGGDTNGYRIAIDITGGKLDTGGTAPTIGVGLRIGNVNGDATQATWTKQIKLENPCTTAISIENSSGTRGIDFTSGASFTLGIDFSSATFSAAPIRMAADQKIQLVAGGSITFGYETTGTKWVFKNGATERVSISTSTGGLSVNGTQVLGGRVTGYAAMTGTANAGAVYDTATVTLAQLAGRVMALQSSMTSHGLIGA